MAGCAAAPFAFAAEGARAALLVREPILNALDAVEALANRVRIAGTSLVFSRSVVGSGRSRGLSGTICTLADGAVYIAPVWDVPIREVACSHAIRVYVFFGI